VTNRVHLPAEARAELSRRADQRVTDDERERAAARIRTAYEVGALSHDELEERVTQAFAARTRADLAGLTRDLPRDGRRRDAARRAGLRAHATTYAAVNGGLVAVWLASGAGEFWPAFPMAGWGIGLAMHARGYRQRTRRKR
jgi:Domain of unknown function (DUF1707)/2TM domain